MRLALAIARQQQRAPGLVVGHRHVGFGQQRRGREHLRQPPEQRRLLAREPRRIGIGGGGNVGDAPRLARLQRGIYYINQLSAGPQFQFFDFASQKSVTVARGLGTYADGFAASSDGHTLLYSRRDSAVDDLMLVENFR